MSGVRVLRQRIFCRREPLLCPFLQLLKLGLVVFTLQGKHLEIWRQTCSREGEKRLWVLMKSLKILLVEDSPSDVRLIREALKETPVPVQITVARDGVEAIEYLHQTEVGLATRPDLMLLDLNLPRKNGREVLAEVKSSPSLKQIPVLIMTSSKSDEDVEQAYSLNANCYIAKPADLNEYQNVVRAIEEFWFMTATLPDTFRFPPPIPRLNAA